MPAHSCPRYFSLSFQITSGDDCLAIKGVRESVVILSAVCGLISTHNRTPRTSSRKTSPAAAGTGSQSAHSASTPASCVPPPSHPLALPADTLRLQPDIVDNLVMEDLKVRLPAVHDHPSLRKLIPRAQLIRLDPQVQPNMVSGVYLKTWTGSVHGAPPTGGGGGGGAYRHGGPLYPPALRS